MVNPNYAVKRTMDKILFSLLKTDAPASTIVIRLLAGVVFFAEGIKKFQPGLCQLAVHVWDKGLMEKTNSFRLEAAGSIRDQPKDTEQREARSDRFIS
jgi:hypothetical protein